MLDTLKMLCYCFGVHFITRSEAHGTTYRNNRSRMENHRTALGEIAHDDARAYKTPRARNGLEQAYGDYAFETHARKGYRAR
ncbi:hypothetical protein SDC9_126769 [bioreactor metagenome]|uniref:Uncharacterized protein n=1 Tax=bioreactor metagenome TaxID=1076179 RepID=A0A645CS45_9ZZZZ